MPASRDDAPLYSTDGRQIVDRRPAITNSPARGGRPPARTPALPNDGVVRVLRDKKGRGGKTVTVVAGLPGGATAVAETAARLKRLCGSGGTVRDGAIEIQGDHRERIAEALRAQGLTVKLAGG
jgi:translation initiation factor 1